MVNRLRRYFDLLRRPQRTMRGMAPDWIDVAIIMTALALLNMLLAWLKADWEGVLIRWVDIVGGQILGQAIAWLGLSVLLYAGAYYLKGYGNFWLFLQYMGYASVPFLLTNSIAIIALLVMRLIFPDSLAVWEVINQISGVIGMAWGWPGCLSHAAVRVVLLLPQKRTLYLFAGLWVLIIFGWLLPIIAPLIFS